MYMYRERETEIDIDIDRLTSGGGGDLFIVSFILLLRRTSLPFCRVSRVPVRWAQGPSAREDQRSKSECPALGQGK